MTDGTVGGGGAGQRWSDGVVEWWSDGGVLGSWFVVLGLVGASPVGGGVVGGVLGSWFVVLGLVAASPVGGGFLGGAGNAEGGKKFSWFVDRCYWFVSGFGSGGRFGVLGSSFFAFSAFSAAPRAKLVRVWGGPRFRRGAEMFLVLGSLFLVCWRLRRVVGEWWSDGMVA